MEKHTPGVRADIIAAIAERGLDLSASLLAVAPSERVETAENLWNQGLWAHAYMIDGRFGSRPSVSLNDIFDIALLNAERTDVHLMVDDPIGWCEQLSHVQRVTVQLHDGLLPDLIAVADAARSIASELWWAVDPTFATGDALVEFLVADCAGTAPDGVLVLLVPPRQEGYPLDPSRLSDVRAARRAVGSVGVNGGVTIGHIGDIADAGARYVVCGRSLFHATASPIPKDTHHHDNR